MSLILPRLPVYYYEITGRRTRLHYCLSHDDLRRLVADQAASEEAVQDYPDGVEIEVDEEAFAQFRKEYSLRHPVLPLLKERLTRGAQYAEYFETRNLVHDRMVPYLLWATFDAFLRQISVWKPTVWETGYLDARSLETTAVKRVLPTVVEMIAVMAGWPREPIDWPWLFLLEDPSAWEGIESRDFRDALAERLAQAAIPEVAPQRPLKEQEWCRVEMAGEMPAAEVFARFQKGN